MKTKWFCEECGTFGAVIHRKDAGVYEVGQKIAKAHREHSAWSSFCGVEWVRIKRGSDNYRKRK